MLENVKALMSPPFDTLRSRLERKLKSLGYVSEFRLMNAARFGVSQQRVRSVLVALKAEFSERFTWPEPSYETPTEVGDLLFDLMGENGWRGTNAWRGVCRGIAPALVGGSRRHGGADLGPSRTKAAWERLGVDGSSVADEAPARSFKGLPKLTLRMTARIQGFPDDWEFVGRKTSAYRQIGNAFPPPLAQAVARRIRLAITPKRRS
jgi:DNA (cytosine-5)-methyltransferase 1